MGNIQIKNVPEGLHDRLRKRAKEQRTSLSEYVLDLIERDLSLPTMKEWSARRREVGALAPGITSEEIVELIHEGREERTRQILEAVEQRRQAR